jgi:hypothetical protein
MHDASRITKQNSAMELWSSHLLFAGGVPGGTINITAGGAGF